MLLLSIDTSGKCGGITLAEGSESGLRIRESAPIAGGTFSAQLVPTVASALGKHGFGPADLGGLIAVSGPGAFTGLRVGLSAVKGFAEVLNKPVVLVSLLEALAISAGHQGTIAAALDAGREEAYFGVYKVEHGRGLRVVEELLSYAQLAAASRDENFQHVVACDPNIFQMLSGVRSGVQRVERPGSEMAARIGWPKLLANQTIDVEELDANYIRRSDAEIFSAGRGGPQP